MLFSSHISLNQVYIFITSVILSLLSPLASADYNRNAVNITSQAIQYDFQGSEIDGKGYSISALKEVKPDFLLTLAYSTSKIDDKTKVTSAGIIGFEGENSSLDIGISKLFTLNEKYQTYLSLTHRQAERELDTSRRYNYEGELAVLFPDSKSKDKDTGFLFSGGLIIDLTSKLDFSVYSTRSTLFDGTTYTGLGLSYDILEKLEVGGSFASSDDISSYSINLAYLFDQK